MYIPASFANSNTNELKAFIRQFNFATLISFLDDANNSQVSHLPLILEDKANRETQDTKDNKESDNNQESKDNKKSLGTLKGHFAKLNPHAKLLAKDNNRCLVIFHGPHAYISPSWYQSYPAVPTWNYAVVHVYGKLQEISQGELILDLEKMVALHEAAIANHNNSGLDSNSDNSNTKNIRNNRMDHSGYIIPKDYQIKLVEHIIGFKIEIEKIEGKFKLGQNRSLEDQAGMLAGLKKDQSISSQSLAQYIESLQKKSQTEDGQVFKPAVSLEIDE